MLLYRVLSETSETLSRKVANTLLLPKDKHADTMIEVNCVLSDSRIRQVSRYLLSITTIDLVGLDGDPNIEVEANRLDGNATHSMNIGRLILQEPPLLLLFDEIDNMPIGDLSDLGKFDLPE